MPAVGAKTPVPAWRITIRLVNEFRASGLPQPLFLRGALLKCGRSGALHNTAGENKMFLLSVPNMLRFFEEGARELLRFSND